MGLLTLRWRGVSLAEGDQAMPPVYVARLYRNEETNFIDSMAILEADEEAAANQAKIVLEARFRGEREARLKPTLVDLCEALPNNRYRVLRRFYLMPDNTFHERPVHQADTGRAARVEQY
ncbi:MULTISPECIES: hypothetical protein [unclassified Brevundimonas]|uniref:hypothetical protein n=1 Tax=unclassified Brevundimonas TaxID=2622653 RepID=UPI0025B7BC87|nr:MULTISPECIES: hypothetical protein [unclassified Brevundimonas]